MQEVSIREQQNFMKAIMSGIPLVDKSAVTYGSDIGEGGYGLVRHATIKGIEGMEGAKVVKTMQVS